MDFNVSFSIALAHSWQLDTHAPARSTPLAGAVHFIEGTTSEANRIRR